MLKWHLFYEYVPIVHVTAQEINYDVNYADNLTPFDMCSSKEM